MLLVPVQHFCKTDTYPSDADQVLDVVGLAVDIWVLGHEGRCPVMPASAAMLTLSSSISSWELLVAGRGGLSVYGCTA